MDDIAQELTQIRERNLRVEADKAWETSLFRKLLIACITYVVVSLVLLVIGTRRFYISSLIPTIGFLLSTLTIPVIKRWWLKNYFK